jgi:Lrp/AsnC family transcriptional regulator, leucine-responsive regulatory protein
LYYSTVSVEQYSNSKQCVVHANVVRALPEFGTMAPMLDRFDLALLNLVQKDDGRTADSLAEEVPLSSSAIARRLRRLRANGWIGRTIALIGPRLTQSRLRAVVLIQLSEHADRAGKAALEQRLLASDEVQFCYEIAGPHDFVALFDCANMADFNACAEELLASTSTVRRYETHFVKREVKFAPFVELGETV